MATKSTQYIKDGSFYFFVIQKLKTEELERWFIVNTNRHKTITETHETFPETF
jgi:hypothetical protein